MNEWLPTAPTTAPTPREGTPADGPVADDRGVRSTTVGESRFLDQLSSAADLVVGRRFREAENEVLRALSIVPADVRGLKLLALVRFKLGRLEEARVICRDLTLALPRDAGIRLNLGLIALKLDRLEESVQELEQAGRLAPDDLRVWSYLGFAYARRGERSRAAAAFRRAGQESHAAELEAAHVAVSEQAVGTIATATAFVQSAPDAALSGPAAASSARGALEFALDGFGNPEVFPESLRQDGRVVAPAGVGGVPVAPLVGYAVARLAPAADQPAWVGATARLPIGEEIFVRGDAAVACTGAARWEIARRRVRGRETAERLGSETAAAANHGDGAGAAPGGDGAGAPLHADEQEAFFRVTGRGEVFVGATEGRLVPLLLEDDILYVREDRVLAFEGKLPWEYGRLPRGGIRMLQFRGRGLVAIRVDGEPGAVKVTPERPLLVTPAHLLGWIGPVVAHGTTAAPAPSDEIKARATPGAAAFGISCEGEGVVLVDVRGNRSKERS